MAPRLLAASLLAVFGFSLAQHHSGTVVGRVEAFFSGMQRQVAALASDRPISGVGRLETDFGLSSLLDGLPAAAKEDPRSGAVREWALRCANGVLRDIRTGTHSLGSDRSAAADSQDTHSFNPVDLLPRGRLHAGKMIRSYRPARVLAARIRPTRIEPTPIGTF